VHKAHYEVNGSLTVVAQ